MAVVLSPMLGMYTHAMYYDSEWIAADDTEVQVVVMHAVVVRACNPGYSCQLLIHSIRLWCRTCVPTSANTVSPSASLLSPHDSSRALHIQLKDVFRPLKYQNFLASSSAPRDLLALYLLHIYSSMSQPAEISLVTSIYGNRLMPSQRHTWDADIHYKMAGSFRYLAHQLDTHISCCLRLQAGLLLFAAWRAAGAAADMVK